MKQPGPVETVDKLIATDEDEPVLLDQGKRLSQSLIWELQRNFFERKGVNAWRDGVVPYYVTSNAFIAGTYAKIVSGFIRDCRNVATDNAPIAQDQPIYIVELGCGHGRFAYHFLKKFLDYYKKSDIGNVPFRYIMSDTGEANVKFWRTHNSLKPFVAEGILDFALFDPVTECELKQIICGETITPGVDQNPIVFFANYFFDSIPMDAFRINEGKLYESLATVTSPREEWDPTDPEIIGRMSISYDHLPAKSDYYDKPDWNRILRRYKESLSDTVILFPTAALECIRNLGRLSGGQMLIISADRGHCLEDELQGRHQVNIATHGSFSLPVNYHAIGRYVVEQGGMALQPGRRADSLIVSAFLFGNPSDCYMETRRTYAETVETFGPDDFFVLKKGIQKVCGNFSLEQLLAFVRLSGWDANIMVTCFSPLMRCLKTADENQKQEAHSVIQKVWDNYYPLGESADVAFHLGTLLCKILYYREALEFLEHSVKHSGHSPGTDYNIALCHMGLGEIDRALKFVRRALKLDPDFEPAKILLQQINSH